MLSFSLTCSTLQAEGISALEMCEKDSAIPLLDELGLLENMYSLPCLSLITSLQRQDGYSLNTIVSPLPDKPPAI